MKINDSKSLLEVWNWKEKAFKEVENMDLKDALKKRIDDSISLAKKEGFKFSSLLKK